MNIDINKNQTFADFAYGAIALSTKKINKNERGVILGEDAEYIHQMRVGLRKLRSVLIGFSPAMKLPKIVEEKKIGKIARILGKKRDNDVLKENLIKYYYHFLNESEQKLCDQFIEHLDKQNKDSHQNIINTLKGKEYQKIKSSLKKWLKEPQFNLIAYQPIEEVANHLIMPQISKMLLQSGWFVGIERDDHQKIMIKEDYSLDQVKDLLKYHEESIHDLRKEAKKTRYQMELLSKCYGKSYDDYLQLIVQVQEILGNIQDNSVLTNRIKNIFGKNWQKKMTNLDILINTNQRQEWLNWQKVQRLFLLENTLKYDELLTLK